MQKPTGETLHILAIDLVTDIAGQVLRDFIVGFAAITGAQEVVAVIHKDDTTAIDLHLSAGQIAVKELPQWFEKASELNGGGKGGLCVRYPCSPGFVAQLKHWVDHLVSAPPLDMPLDKPRPPVLSGRSAAHPFVLSADILARCENLALCLQQSQFLIFLTSWKLLLCRHSRTEDITVGVSYDGQRSTRHPLPVRVDFSDGGMTFAELLGRVDTRVQVAFENIDVPFHEARRAVQRRSQATSAAEMETNNLQAELIYDHGLTTDASIINDASLLSTNHAPHHEKNSNKGMNDTQFELSLRIGSGEGGTTSCSIEYSTDLFEPDTIARLAEHLLVLVEAAASAPTTPARNLPIMNEAERHQVTVEWNKDTVAPFPSDKCVHELFEEQAIRTPTAVAVVFEGSEVTYAELDARAGAVARRLKDLGVVPNMLVGLLVERSVEMMVGMMGILKAGGAVVPIDPTYPADRIQHYLQDSGATILVTTQECLGKVEGADVLVRVLVNSAEFGHDVWLQGQLPIGHDARVDSRVGADDLS